MCKNDELPPPQISVKSAYTLLKASAFVVGCVVSTLAFLTPRTAHNALAADLEATKSQTTQELKLIREENRKALDLLCVLSVDLIGKEAVTQYCTNHNRR